MRLGNPPGERFRRLTLRDDLGYHDRMIQTAGVFKQLWPDNPEYAVKKMYEASDAVLGYRAPQHGEIERVVNFVYSGDFEYNGKAAPRPDKALMAEVGRNGSLSTLKESSGPIPDDPSKILEDLYPDDPLLTISKDVFTMPVRRRSEWQSDGIGLTSLQYVCPNPVKDPKDGRMANNILERRYAVFESDICGKDWDKQAALILRLAKEMPLKCVVFSGGKSLHAWYSVMRATKAQLDKFFTLALKLGGDCAALRPNQLVRLPLGKREDNSKIQRILFYDYDDKRHQ